MIQRRHHSARLKARVALAALTRARPVARIAAQHRVSPQTVRRWRTHLVARAEEVFARGLPAAELRRLLSTAQRALTEVSAERDVLARALARFPELYFAPRDLPRK